MTDRLLDAWRDLIDGDDDEVILVSRWRLRRLMDTLDGQRCKTCAHWVAPTVKGFDVPDGFGRCSFVESGAAAASLCVYVAAPADTFNAVEVSRGLIVAADHGCRAWTAREDT